MRRIFVSLAMLFVAVPAHAEWWEARTDHFIIYSKSSAADAKAFAESLERYDESLRSIQMIKPDLRLSDSRRVKIYRAGLIVDIATLYGDSDSPVAGFYVPYLEPVAFVPARERAGEHSELDALTILNHEYTHHFMFRYFPGAYPTWYVEGIAELYSTVAFKPDGSFHLGNPPQARGDALVGKYHAEMHRSIRDMLTTTSKPTGEDFYSNYTYGWLLTHYLSFEPSRRGQLLTYLRLIDKGTSVQQAAQQAFGDLDKLEAEVNRYKNSGKYYGKDIMPANYHAPVAEMRRLGPDEEAIMPSVMRTRRGVWTRIEKGVASDAQSVAARYPNSFPVQLELAEAELDAKEIDAADRAADTAIALKGDSAEALMLKGSIALEKAKTNPTEYAAARSWFAKAAAADSDNPGPLIGNYLSYSKAGGAIPESAIIGLEQAYRLAPHFEDLRIILARQLLTENKLDIAKDLLVPLALSPHENKQAKALSEVVDQIDASNRNEAIAKLDAWTKKLEELKKRND